LYLIIRLTETHCRPPFGSTALLDDAEATWREFIPRCFPVEGEDKETLKSWVNDFRHGMFRNYPGYAFGVRDTFAQVG
jgi:hypothetical protein